MNAKRLILISLFIEILALAAPSRAYDIDIYSTVNTNAAAPNIMVVIDNPSSQDASIGSCSYFDGTSPPGVLAGKSLGADMCALVNLVNGLKTKGGVAQLNLGFTTMSGVNFPLTPVDDNPYAGPSVVCVGGSSLSGTGNTGCTSVTLSGLTNRKALILAIQALSEAPGKSGQGAMFEETWAYLTGGIGTFNTVYTGYGLLSQRNYPTADFPKTTATSGCQRNYIIYLSAVNAGASHAQTFSQKAPSEDSQLDAAANLAVLSTTAGGLGAYGPPYGTTNPTFLKVDPLATGYTGLIAYPTGEAQWGLEWARFMNATDIGVSSGAQTVITYSVATGNTATPGTAITNNMEQYIYEVAMYGGGKYFAAGSDPNTLQADLLTIFNEVQAVNSVFASSSLPVSVNAQGTFLNQIYMGMFRPDPNGNPRWLGNLKQYQFALNQTSNTLFLADSLGNAALNPSTGFLTSEAISFWTCTYLATSPYPDPYVSAKLSSTQITTLIHDLQGCTDPLPNGFWANDPSSVNAAAKGFDLPDGERVERGGAAQQIRQTNMLDNYTYLPETTQNPRQLYTWCPSGSGCVATFENPTLNPNPNVFDTSNPLISDALLGTGLQAIKSITSLPKVQNPSTWTAPSSGSLTITGLSKSGNTFTGTASQSDIQLLIVGMPLTFGGNYCNPCTVASINTSAGSFTYTGSSGTAPGTPISATFPAATITSPIVATNISPGQLVTINGCTSYTAWNGQVGMVFPASTSNNYVFSVSVPATYVPSSTAPIVPSWDTGCYFTPNTATVAMVNPSPFLPSDTVTIAGASPTAYNGAWSNITLIDAYTFSYQYTSAGPLNPWNSAGATASVPSLTRDALTKWVRGDDNRGDEASLCPPGTTAGTGNCPNPAVTIRPSVHGDVLHARPTVINYGYYTATITGTTDSSGTRTATLSSADVTAIGKTGFNPVITFANGDACAVTIPSASTTTIQYQSLNCGAAGGQTVTYGSKVVVFYGDNGGVFHAVNGDRSQSVGTAGPGDEIWGFIPKEFFSKFRRLMLNTPIVKMPSNPVGASPTPQPKDWFVDGAPGVYQVIDASTGSTQRAIIYLAMRRGTDATSKGFIYALDVSQSLNPYVLWKADPTGVTSGSGAFTASSGFAEMGQTWSQPKVAFINGYCNSGGASTPPACSATNPPSPVLIMGAGYDPNEDNEPMTGNDTQGRGIFILDALTGKMIWSVSPTGTSGCSSGTTPPCHQALSTMLYSIPSDITLVDRDNDGYIDRLYAADTGGNIFRVDLEPPKTNALNQACSATNPAGCTPDVWTPYLIAALGGSTGPCYPGTSVSPCTPTQRKFFYPPEVIAATATYKFDAVIAGSGDREHPLSSFASSSSTYYNRIFLLKDVPGNDGSQANYYPMSVAGTNFLLDCTDPKNCLLPGGASIGSSCTANQYYGYYITLAAGEKVVNAPLVVAGLAYMGTNQPTPPSATSCLANLGIATGYQLSPFTCTTYTQVFAGGGLPPSPVAGVVDVVVNGVVKREPFLIGGVSPNCVGADCKSALGAQKPPINVPTTRHRTYRYIKGK